MIHILYIYEFQTKPIHIKSLNEYFQVEENQLVVWIQEHSYWRGTDAAKTDINDGDFEKTLIGIQMSRIKDCSALLLALDYLS